jgi:hypothetical protein
MTIASSLSSYTNDEAEGDSETGILEEAINLELDSVYQSTPLSGFEEAIVS